ncbi:hypothetical protein RB195_003943 [Necator americanus]|uniref:Uncharacterized protein n=1 Tax=Necator americanus TaxID=51031 RepID=A0ABR1DQY0_NECAM
MVQNDNGSLFSLCVHSLCMAIEGYIRIKITGPWRAKIHLYLSLPTLRRFMFLSRECLSLVTSMKVEAMSMNLDDNTLTGHRKDAVTIRISRRIKTPYLSCFITHFDLQFLDLEDGGCFVAREVMEDKHKVVKVGANYSQETRYSAALRVFVQFTKWIKTEGLHITMSPTDAEIKRMHAIVPIGRKFSCCSLVINEYTQLEDDGYVVDHDFFDSEVAKYAPSMNIHGMTEITDEQLLLLQADTLFVAGPSITPHAINRIIWQWFEGKRKISQMFFDAIKDHAEETILMGFDSADFLNPDLLLDIVTEIAQWRVREASRPWVGLRNKDGLVIMVKIGRHSCNLVNLELN